MKLLFPTAVFALFCSVAQARLGWSESKATQTAVSGVIQVAEAESRTTCELVRISKYLPGVAPSGEISQYHVMTNCAGHEKTWFVIVERTFLKNGTLAVYSAKSIVMVGPRGR